MRTYLKTLGKMYQKHLLRFISLILMVLISVGFISGIGSLQDKINYSLSDYYKAQSVSDFIIKSKSEDGFSQQDADTVKEIFKGANVDTGISLDLTTDEKRSLRLYFLDFENTTVNIPDLVEGTMPKDKAQAYAEQADNVIKGYASGEEIELSFKEILTKLSEQNGKELDGQITALLDRLSPVKVTVSGIVQSPLTFARDGEPSYNNPEDAEISYETTGTTDMDCLENILYLSKDLIPTYRALLPFVPEENNKPLIATGDIYVAIENRNLFDAFSRNYKNAVADGKEKICAALTDVEVITLYDNFSFQSLTSYGKKVAAIGYVLMAAFLLVTALVVFSTMTRLIDEERAQIACLKTLGYSSRNIVSKYLLFALTATLIGGGVAYLVGLGLTYLLYFIFNYSFCMPPMSSSIAIVYYIITVTAIVAGTLVATAISGFKTAGERPANLLRPRPPKSGKKVFLERIPFLWKRLSFKYKSTLRNVLRYKGRFFMTVIAVALSTALVLVGLGLLDLCLFHDFGSASIMGISMVVVIFAGLLTVLVIYTLTNINISERNREIATLMVLGYQNREVYGYIFREVIITSLIGILFGYPLSCLLNWIVFTTIGFGTLNGISWFVWLIAPFIVELFTYLVTLVLRRRITKIDMNESLKAIE